MNCPFNEWLRPEPMILARNLIVHNAGEGDLEAPDGSKD